MAFIALIPAGGAGTRLQGGVPKQYLPLAGRPMLWHAIAALCVPPIETVFVALAPGDEQFARHDWGAFAGRLEPLYCAGATRRETVFNGLVAATAILDADDWVLVHDAARPCLPRRDLEQLLAETKEDAIGGILAVPAADTVKRAAKDEAGVQRIAATEDRAQLWLAQTPQMFRFGVLLDALRRAPASITDEAGALEARGLRPRLVTGSRDNVKVTFPEDLGIAEAILERAAKAAR